MYKNTRTYWFTKRLDEFVNGLIKKIRHRRQITTLNLKLSKL